MIRLIRTRNSNPALREMMAKHYTKPEGFIGRNLCYAVFENSGAEPELYGYIVGGSAALNLPGRHDFLGTTKDDLNKIVNNIFFHIEPIRGEYPQRNFTSAVVQEWMLRSIRDWERIYGDEVVGFETMVEIPVAGDPSRSGELYRRAGWTEVGTTLGQQAQWVAGPRKSGKENKYGGHKTWEKDKSKWRPKWVFCYKVTDNDRLAARKQLEWEGRTDESLEMMDSYPED